MSQLFWDGDSNKYQDRSLLGAHEIVDFTAHMLYAQGVRAHRHLEKAESIPIKLQRVRTSE